jgi:hypothetical protein
MNKVIEIKEQYAKIYKMLAVWGYDVILLSVVLGSAGTLFCCLDRATKEWTTPMPEEQTYTSSFTYTAYTVYKSLTTPGKTKANLRSKGNDKRQITSFPPQIVYRDRPVYPPPPYGVHSISNSSSNFNFNYNSDIQLNYVSVSVSQS